MPAVSQGAGVGCLPAGIGTCFTLVVTTPATSDGPAQGTALARSQAARRRRVLDAALRLAERGGFDAVQMRDVATEANVALGTVYRYFTSKERLLLEAMVEEIEALASRLESRPPVGATPADRIVEVLSRGTASLQRPSEADPPPGVADRSRGALRLRRASLARHHAHRDLHRLAAAAEDDAAQRHHVGEVGAGRQRDVAAIGKRVVGRVELDPAVMR